MYPLTEPVRASLTRDRRWTSGALRASALLIAALGAAACAGNSANRTPNAALVVNQESPTQTALRTMLRAKDPRTESGASARSDSVLRFYQSRNFLPAWSGDAEKEGFGQEVRAALAHAQEQGLRAADYKFPAGDMIPASGQKAAEYEIALTDALLRYARDVRTGRVRSTDVYTDVLLPVSGFEPLADLTAALGTHALGDFLAGLPPTHPQYRQLAEALARYRAIAEEGGWPSLPGKNAIKFDGNDPRTGALVKRLAFEDPVLAAIASPSMAELREAVKRFQLRNGLEDDGRVGGETLAALDVSASTRADEIAANMERWRWLPGAFERRYVAVNVPDQSLQFVRDGMPVLTSKVIVGNPMSPTPITRSEIVAVVANPPWNIPGDIAARDLLPHLRKSANYLATKHMVVTDGPPGDPYGRTIDWKKIIPAEFPYAIQQLPGPTTALGALMLDSPNDFDVYLHDTPNKKRFESDMREISNGCVRVQEIISLASLALTGDAAKATGRLNQVIKTRQTQRIALDAPLPVYFLYWTALAGPDGTVGFRSDPYGRDAPLIAALSHGGAKPPVQAAAPPAGEAEPMEADELSP